MSVFFEVKDRDSAIHCQLASPQQAALCTFPGRVMIISLASENAKVKVCNRSSLLLKVTLAWSWSNWRHRWQPHHPSTLCWVNNLTWPEVKLFTENIWEWTGSVDDFKLWKTNVIWNIELGLVLLWSGIPKEYERIAGTQIGGTSRA